MIEEEDQADQHEERARDDAAAAAERYANYHRTTPRFLFFVVARQAGMNAPMNLVVEIVTELFRIKFFLVAHGILLSSSRCSLRFCSLINVPPLPRNPYGRPALRRSPGKHHVTTLLQRRSGSQARMIPISEEDSTKTRRDRKHRSARHEALRDRVQGGFPWLRARKFRRSCSGKLLLHPGWQTELPGRVR